MFLKKSKVLTVLSIIIVLIFAVSYKWGLEKYTSIKSRTEEQYEDSNKYTLISSVDKVLSSNVKIILNLSLKNNSKNIEVKRLSLGDLQSEISGKLTLRNLEEYYDKLNYKLVSNKEDEIIFVKESPYEPQKYYLGATKDGFVAIFKCDDNGNLAIEDPVEDISNKKVTEFPLSDQKYINNFEFEFDTKEQAVEELIAIIS
jgi:hypothetical protein